MKKKFVSQNTGKTGVTDFLPDKKAHTQPNIVDQFVDDSGETMYVTDKGTQVSKIMFDAMWGVPKGVIKNKGYKGEPVVPAQKIV